MFFPLGEPSLGQSNTACPLSRRIHAADALNRIDAEDLWYNPDALDAGSSVNERRRACSPLSAAEAPKAECPPINTGERPNKLERKPRN